ncbi:App1 family protein [Costertonia aggregata]|uniref:DUF2183 domain-containing protein n=1 Tax=Costertonia aggregata TaxID=343403 RepID=A0A7H9ALZ4_9FLAO|nr:phosphatase domain-containing protein [Costertonia aggregata]QLG44468.1 DUF2183 domain-containing protein [Costertonia aggregata]
MGIFGKKDKLQIIAFQTYGTDTHLYLRGRALEDEGIDLAQKGFFKLFLNTWKRFETDEIKHTGIKITLPDDRTLTGTTDKNGYYLIDDTLGDLEKLTNAEGWLQCEISYTDESLKREILNQNRFPAEILIPSKTSEFGVISDIDDTILHTGVVSLLKWQVIFNTFFKRATKRKPLEGAAEFYHLLHRGKSGKRANPIFYVSHSPWNLYRYLEMFLTVNKFPKGPIILRSFVDFRSKKPQKQKEVLNILKTYPDMKFILIGDSGEHDADIYMQIAKNHPNRVAAIYLRTVRHKKRVRRIKNLIENYTLTPVLLIEKSEDALVHAKNHGFIA